jgi:peptide/nickel transport system permease protein
VRKLFLESTSALILAALLVSGLLALLDTTADASVQTGWLGTFGGLIGRLFRIDFSDVACTNTLPTGEYVRVAFLRSVRVVGAALLAMLLLAVPVGVLAAQRERYPAAAWFSRGLGTASSLPVLFWLVVFTMLLRQRDMFFTLDSNPIAALTVAVGALLLGDRLFADLAGRVELATREVLAEPYLRTVRAAGLNVRRHLVQSLVPPVATAVASRAMFLVSGTVVVEKLLQIRGLGWSVFEMLSCSERQLPTVLFIALLLVVIGLLVRLAAQGSMFLADGRRRG